MGVGAGALAGYSVLGSALAPPAAAAFCEETCPGNQVACGGGECCPTGTFCCEFCENLAKDRDNCGTCFHQCPPGQHCVNGVCGGAGGVCTSAGRVECNGECCKKGQLCCNGKCTKVDRSEKHCGGCGRDCTGGTCIDGFCC
jgi:hypothetical protein